MFINNTLKAVEAVGQGVNLGESEACEQLFADNSFGMSTTPMELQKQTDGETDFSRKWRPSAHVK